MAMLAALLVYPHISGASGYQNQVIAASDKDGLTIGDVAAMEPRQAISYVYRIATRRALELSQKHGDAMSQCLRREVVRIEKKPDGNHEFPRGLHAAIKLVHRHNNNGGSSLSALEQIYEIVDLISKHACSDANTSVDQ